MVRILATLSLFIFSSNFLNGQASIWEADTVLMGSYFSISLRHSDSTEAQSAIQEAFDAIAQIEKNISSWNPDSYTSEINRNAGLAEVTVPQFILDLIRRSKKISNLSDGAFDLSFGPLGQIWDWSAKPFVVPDSNSMNAAQLKVDFRKIRCDEVKSSIFLEEPGMSIGFGGIGKGYAAMQAKSLLFEQGFEHGIVNAGGDLICWGEESFGEAWLIGLAKPDGSKKAMAYLKIENLAVVTSGSYEKFTIVDGKRYSHIVDPRTGYPVDHLLSTTILCPDAELGDALATAVFVLGPEAGLELVEKLKNIEAILITPEGEIIESSGVNLNFESVEKKTKHTVLGTAF